MRRFIPETILLAAVIASVALPAPADERRAAHDEANAADVPLAPSEGGPRRWQVAPGTTLDVRDAPSPEATIVARPDEDSVLHNFGCERSGNGAWCEVETFRGKVRGHAPAAHLRPAIGPDGTVPSGVDDSASRARGGDFDVRGPIPCAQERGQPMGECAAGVARGGGGDAIVVAEFPNGFRRTLRFVHGEFVSADATMSGSGSDVDWRRQGELHLVRVDDQRYELRDDFLFGH